MLPFYLSPAFKDYLWGGTKLKTQYHKSTDLPVVAESWELSAHPDGDGVISGGELDGMRFSEFVRRYPALLGARYAGREEFPLLIKLIDAKQALSIQVHPDDAYARRVEGGAGKTEMWYIVDCEPGAFLYFGFEREITPHELERRIADDTVTEALRRVPVQKGDLFFIRAGTVHAIGAGILLAEIQQNSNTTYRVYDFGRLGADGKPRPLHIEKAKAVACLGPADPTAPGAGEPVELPGCTLRRLARCDYFTTDLAQLRGTWRAELDGTSFVSLLCVDGAATLACGGAELPVAAGQSVFLPADNPEYTLTGEGRLLITTL